ncbi:hypothetical protein SEA_YDN12_34 [Streptomyces phage YDN12]|uniref:C2H2-type domain-containing protein n=1 Tax=Streptomyces phage YDN12 TaxID=1636183 RepID=A0A0E3JJD0_9CAUD|nr:hypothetical protein AVT63_gp33 [Streptomyces phage YDN12]AKA61701.1 hypothetical protein SEA_YDN12_34 [Streptomyces phage YDN12]
MRPVPSPERNRSMTELQCPYCPETRPSRSRLVTHVDGVHGAVSVTRRTLDLRSPRTVETVSVVTDHLAYPCRWTDSDGDQCSRPEHLFRDGKCMSCDAPELSDVTVVQCVCGAPIEPLDEDTTYPGWTHVFGVSTGKCTDAIPAAGMPTKADREGLDAALARTGAGLAEAGREMAEMRAALDAVDARMAKLDAQLTSPATVRRATLNQVWDRLIDAGDLTGAAIVMKMIAAVVDD